MANETDPVDKVEIVSPYTDIDKEDFIKSVLSDQPFTSEYKLFNEQFNIKLRSLTVEESTEVFTQLKKDQTAGRIGSDATYLLSLTNYRLCLSLLSINNIPFQPELTKERYTPEGDTDSYIRARAKPFLSWPVFKLSAVGEVFREFEDKLVDLSKEIQNKNFWIAAQ